MMANLRIGPRLLLGFGVVVLLTIALGLFALEQHAALQSLTEHIDSRDFAMLHNLQAIIHAEDQMRNTRSQVLLSAFLTRDHLPADPAEALEQQWLQARDRADKVLRETGSRVNQFEAEAISADRATGWGRVKAAVHGAQESLAAISPQADRLFASVNAGDLAAAASRTREIDRIADRYQSHIAEAHQAVQEQIQLGRREVEQQANRTRNSIILVLVIAATVGVAFAVVIHRSITKPLQEFMTVVERVGQGDLTLRVAVSRPDELGDLGRSLDKMVTGLKNVAVQTRHVAESINTATAEILASTQQQAASTAEQAAAVQQANATMAQIAQAGAQISDRARQVAAGAEATSNASATGLKSVRNTSSLMEGIREQAEAVAENVIALSEKTQAIGEIITSVDDIAEQSHLLALNASIQAAAAGEHGRTFSIVANEMKNLAAESKQATLQVRSILGDIQKGITGAVMLTEEAVKRVESGRQQAGVADSTIRELTDNIEESVRAFQQIVGGSSQQQIGFEQVTQAFRNIGIASQETAVSTRQSEKAAANLSVLAQELRSAVARYQV